MHFFILTLLVGSLLTSQAMSYSIHSPAAPIPVERVPRNNKPTTTLAKQVPHVQDQRPRPNKEEALCWLMGSRCKMVDGRATLQNLDKHQDDALRARDFDPGVGIDGHKAVVTKDDLDDNRNKHPDGNPKHTYWINYSNAVVPIGVCNPKLFLQYLIDYGCTKGVMQTMCQTKAQWPCEYQDASPQGKDGWSPPDDGQTDVRQCTMGITANLISNQDSPDGLHNVTSADADFLKDFAVGAMASTMHVDGGNKTMVPFLAGDGEDEDESSNGSQGRPVTVYQIPAAMTVWMYDSDSRTDMNKITVEVSFLALLSASSR